MRPALLSLVPMLVAAILVMVGGERLARQTKETRDPVDRERLLDFDQRLREELDRLDALYLGHLDRLAETALGSDAEERIQAAPITGVLRLQTFGHRSRVGTIDAIPRPPKLPELVIEGGKRPLERDFSVTLEPDILSTALTPETRWRDTPLPGMRLYLSQPEPEVLVAIFIDVEQLRQRTAEHLGEWLEMPITPLREAGERVRLSTPGGDTLAAVGSAHHGPAAAILPVRTSFGTWQVEAWDGITLHSSHDTATLASSAALAVLLALSGIVLFLQQRRALRLAAERVSFVNRVSHELGAPLTNLALNLELARDHLPHPPEPARRRLDLVSEEIQRLSRLVANVLTFSRRERDTLEVEPRRCLPAEVIRDTLDSFRPALARRGIEIVTAIDADQPVLLDPDALAQITGNLISNVEKYAAEGGWMHLHTRVANGTLTLDVKDRGPGIPAAARQRIFAPFERVHRTTNEGSSGTGLGLTIARELAHRMGGGLELLDTSTGAAFRLKLPAPPALRVLSPDAA